MCAKGYYSTVALVLFGFGGLIGNYVFGYLQDYWGRRPSYYVYLALEIVSCVLSTFAWNFWSWLVFRFIVGLTVPAILSSPYVLGKLTLELMVKLLEIKYVQYSINIQIQTMN